MFWGITVKAGDAPKPITFTGDLTIVNAALEQEEGGDKPQARLYLKVDGKMEFLICTLNESNLTHGLTLDLMEGENLALVVKGSGIVHLTGTIDEGSVIDDSSVESSESPISA